MSLAHITAGFSGIPQDSRLLFDGLAQSKFLSPSGLIWSVRNSWRGSPPSTLEDQSVFLGYFLSTGSVGRRNILLLGLNKINSSLAAAFERIVLNNRTRHNLYEVKDGTLQDIIWRTILSMTVHPKRRTELLAEKYFLTTLGLRRVSDGVMGRLPRARLDTAGYDFAVFQDARAVRVSRGTRKVVRYHDGLPVLSSDTAASAEYTRIHSRSVNACEADSLFVCNSPIAKADLQVICPKAAENAQVIPYFIPKMTRSIGVTDLKMLALPRVFESTLGKNRPDEVVARWFANDEKNSGPEYIMTLGTIEPRKNLRGLIGAWQKLRNMTGKNVKLLVIGSPGWRHETTLRDMERFVATGQLLHLAQVSQDELPYWYSAARCFAFVSFAEGFGIPPIEAMQCSCPVLASDIPAHRYSSGDAAMYCDPYDIEEIAAKLDFLTQSENRNAIQTLVARGTKNADRFTVTSVLPLWEELFASQRSGL